MKKENVVSKTDLNISANDNQPTVSFDENTESSINFAIEDVYSKEKSTKPLKRMLCTLHIFAIQVLLSIWYTKQTADPSNRDSYVVVTLKELLIYLAFLTLLSIVAFGMNSSSRYYFRKAMSSILIDPQLDQIGVNFRKASQIHHFWIFTEKVLVDALYWDHWHNIKDMANSSKKYAKILYENELLGLPRLRQLRVRNDSCIVQDYFLRLFNSCYDTYSSTAEYKGTYGPGDGTAWWYHSPIELGGMSHTGLIKSYPPGGYFLDLDPDKNETINALRKLKKNSWIDRGTRVVFIDLTVYNANVNLFCIIRLVMEFPPTGGVVPSWSFHVANLIRYFSSFDYFVLCCEILFVLFIIFYTAEEIYEMILLRTDYLFVLWSYVDLIILLISWAAIAMHLVSFTMTKEFLKQLVETSHKFNDFYSIGYLHAVFSDIVSLLVLFAWLKLFKYVGFNKTMTQLGRTLSRSAKDVGGFSVMFLIVFFAFVQLGYLLFGSQVEGFISLGESVFTLLRIVLGDFEFDSLQNASPILGPLFFFCFVFFIFFILLNMFLAIINVTYLEIKSEINARRQDYELVRYLKKLIGKLKTVIGLHTQYGGLEDSVGKISLKAVKENLRQCNFSEFEIEMFFDKYGLSAEGFLNEVIVNQITEDLYGNHAYFDEGKLNKEGDENPIPQVTREELNVLRGRILQAEITLEILVDKIEKLSEILDEINSKC